MRKYLTIDRTIQIGWRLCPDNPCSVVGCCLLSSLSVYDSEFVILSGNSRKLYPAAAFNGFLLVDGRHDCMMEDSGDP